MIEAVVSDKFRKNGSRQTNYYAEVVGKKDDAVPDNWLRGGSSTTYERRHMYKTRTKRE